MFMIEQAQWSIRANTKIWVNNIENMLTEFEGYIYLYTEIVRRRQKILKLKVEGLKTILKIVEKEERKMYDIYDIRPKQVQLYDIVWQCTRTQHQLCDIVWQCMTVDTMNIAEKDRWVKLLTY